MKLKFLTPVLWALMLAVILSLSSCALTGFGLTPSQVLSMTPEQIQALKDQNFKIWTCSRLGGPPPVGNSILIIVPKDSSVQYRFTADCLPMQ